MSIAFAQAHASFSGVVGVADADSLLEWVQQKPDATIDLTDCTHVHPAVVQIILASGACVSAWPADPDLERWLSILRTTPGTSDDQP